MAIRKCPYCKAIIEEGAEFCSNCGTQLLFPEDAKIDEEIPGEKIVDDVTDDDDDDEEIELPEDEKAANPDAGDLLKSDEEEEPTEPVEKKTEKSVDLQDVKEDQEPKEEIQEKKDGSDDFQMEEKEMLPKEKEAEPDVKKEVNEEKIHEVEAVEISLEGVDEEVLPEEKEAEPVVKEEVSEEKIPEVESVEINLEDMDEETVVKEKEIEKEIHSDSKEEVLEMENLEKTVESSDFEKQEIDRFIDSMKKDQGVDVEEPFEEEPDEEKIEEDPPKLSSTLPIFKKQVIVPPTDDLPAWASKIKEKPPSSIPKEKTPTKNSGLGLPEVVSQKDLPFSEETIEAEEEKTKVPPSQLSIWLKSRIFDVLFIGAVWFITTWIASYVMEVKLFKLISVAALLLMAFYVVLLSAYLFLFYFFLGETLGDYLFNPVHKAGADHLT